MWAIPQILCDRFDRRRIMFWISALAAISALVVSMLGSHQLLALTLAVAVFTGLSASIYPVAVAITNDRMESSRIVAASATLLLSYGIGSVIGPVVLSKLIQLLGPEGLFYGYAAALIVLAAATSYRIPILRTLRWRIRNTLCRPCPKWILATQSLSIRQRLKWMR